MSSPIKPWERRQREPHGNGDNLIPPPVPSRPNSQANRSGTYGGYGGLSSAYGSSMYGSGYGLGYSGYGNSYGGIHGNSYGSYGMGGYGMNRMGYGSSLQPSTSFSRVAEETSQPAFDSIMSVVQAFGSISQMLESTFFAVHSSFRAVLGVADQFSSLKIQLLNTLGAFTILKTIRYIFRKLMIWLRLRASNPSEDLWNAAADNMADKELRKSAKAWPLVLFLSVIFGTPWLIWKFIQLIAGEEVNDRQLWMTGTGEHYEARAEYDFDAENADELSFQSGMVLRIAPKGKQPRIRGWLLASDGTNSGIVPANYIKILGRRSGKEPISNRVKHPSNNQNELDSVFSESSLKPQRQNGRVSGFNDTELSSDSSPTDN